MKKIFTTLFVLTLAASVAGGLVFVAVQLLGVAAGAGPFTVALNSEVKPWIVGVSAVCAMLSFVLSYMRGADAKEEKA